MSTFVVIYSSNQSAGVVQENADSVFEEMYGKEVYLQYRATELRDNGNLEDTIQGIRQAFGGIRSMEDKTVEIGPYLVRYKLIVTNR